MIFKNVNLYGKPTDIRVENGKFTEIGHISDDGIDMKGLKAFPGLIDVHTHGIMGYDTMDADFKPMCEAYAKLGTTSFLPTTMTMGYDDLQKVSIAETKYNGANILGFHFEGPYISAKRKGAQDEKNIKVPNVDEFRQFRNVKMITVAPEVENGIEFINAVSKDTVVSLGHTDCDYDTAIRAIDAGANCLTHTFNVMPPLLHRAPGPIGAAVEKNIYAQIICDGFHISRAAVIAAYRMFGCDRMCLISDSIRPAKLPEGKYESGGLDVFVKDDSIRLKDGTIAGSYACLFDCVKKAIEFGIPETDAFRMASETPATLLGVNKGKIQNGYDADFILTDESYDLKYTVIGGDIFYIKK